MSVVLGINAAYHESAAALVRDGRLVAAVEEERLTRRAHGKSAEPTNPDALPEQAIAWVLAAAGLAPGDVDRVAYGLSPGGRLANVGRDAYLPQDGTGWGTPAGERAFEAALGRVPAQLERQGIRAPLQWVSHHRAHAASAFYPSGFAEAGVLVLDGIGEISTGWVGRGSALPGGELRCTSEIDYPHSVGLVWERVAVHLGFTEYDAAKVMGLAAWGDPAPRRGAMRRLLTWDEADQAPRVDLDLARFRAPDTGSLVPLFGPPRAAQEPPTLPRFADTAAALQEATEAIVLGMARRTRREAGASRLCYAGGVALNCVANAALERAGIFESLYIPPAPHDAGSAVGAALDLSQRLGEPVASPGAAPPTPFLGPAFDAVRARSAADALGMRARASRDAPREAAALLAAGALVGWFDGALEWGPRALGHRSLLADPRNAPLSAELNRAVKHREPFRPFGASILAERAASWLELPTATEAHSRELMLFAYPVRAERRGEIPAVVHADGSCRVQLVAPGRDPAFHALLLHFDSLTGVPLVLNTSFNDREPLVCSPEDALRMARRGGVGHVFLGALHVDCA